MSDINSIAKDLAKIIKESDEKKTSAYDTPAQVMRIEGNTAWVHIPGGVDETPVKLTVSASVGDTVQIRVAGGRAWITGNASAPPTDDRMANTANANAKVAYNLAGEAQDAANEAYSAAESAQASAAVASTAAASAETSATKAMNGLSEVEKVIDVLTWIAEHGEYALTTDTAVQEGKTYFIRSGTGTEQDPYIYTPVDNPSGDPSTLGYYELTGVDEAVTNYISTHLALLDDGLYITLDNTGYKVKITNTAVYIINNLGETIATYTNTTTIGSILSNNVFIDEDSVDIRQGDTTVASFGAETRIGEQGKSGVAFNSTETVFYDAQGSEAAHIGQGATFVKEIAETYIGGSASISTSQPLRVTCLLSDIAIIDGENSIAVGIIFASGSSRYNFTMTISSADTDFTATRGIFTFTVHYSSTLNRMSVVVSASSTVSNLSRISVTCTYNYTGLAPTYTFGLGLESTEPYSFIVGQYNEDNYNLFAVGNGTDDNNRHNIFGIDLNGVTVNDGDFSVVNGTTSVGELWTDEIIASGTITASQNIIFDTVGKGLYALDYSGFSYPLIRDNGTNLWIGATQSSAQHHTGATYISSGYNSSLGEGYESVFVSVPNATNTGASQYAIYHKGNLTNATTSDSGLMSNSDKTKINKFAFSPGVTSVNFGDGNDTAETWLWGNSTNKVGIGAYNNTDDKRYNLLARANRISLYNSTDSTTEWDIYPTSGTAPISVNNGVVSISNATTSASGAMSASDKSKLDGIGTIVNVSSGTVSLASGTGWQSTGKSFTLSAGTWVVDAGCSFANNATGRRGACISASDGGSQIDYLSVITSPAVSGSVTYLSFTWVIQVTASTTYYLSAVQNSGGTLNCYPRVRAVRVA